MLETQWREPSDVFWALQRLLGHDTLQTTEIYLNLSPEHVVEEFQQKWRPRWDSLLGPVTAVPGLCYFTVHM